jgi:polysaccharide biosynthesis transport protein
MALTETTTYPLPRPAPSEVEIRQEPAAVIDLRGVLDIFKRRLMWILLPALVCTIAASAIVLAMPPRFTATAQILLDLQGLRVLQNDLTPRADQSSDAQLTDAESQLQVISSGEVLTAVVEREKLQDDPEFGGAQPGPLEWLFGHSSTAPTEQDRILRAVNVLRNRLVARRPDKTFVIDISIWSSNRDKAARLANDIANVYLEQQLAAKTAAAKRTNAALTARLAELRDRVSASAHRVEDYRAQHQIIGAGGQLISEQQLGELNNQLVLAQTAAAEQKSRYDDIVRLQRTHSDPDAIAEVIQSPTITALRGRYADAKRVWADETATLGPRHPKVEAAAAQVEQARNIIDDEVARIGKTALSDYNRAQANVETLQQKLQALKDEVSETRQSLVRLRELEREADADRVIYDALLSRAKEVGEQEGVDNTNSRMITRAVPPANRSGPPRLLIVAGALGVGLLVGLGLALVRDQLASSSMLPRPRRTESGLRVLASLPDCSELPIPIFEPKSPHAAAIKRLLGALNLDARAAHAKVVAVDSPGDAELRSLIALNLAISAGKAGKRVLWVEGNRPPDSATRGRGKNDKPHNATPRRAYGLFRTPWEGVKIMRIDARAEDRRTGSPADDARNVLEVNASTSDLIVIDGDLLFRYGPLSDFVRSVDDVLIVAQNDRARSSQIKEALADLGPDRNKAAGLVLVG